MAIKTCIVCGATFTARNDAKYCSRKCLERNRVRVRRKSLSPNGHYKRIKKNGNMRSIAEMDAKAKELGMSYGQYVGLLNL